MFRAARGHTSGKARVEHRDGPSRCHSTHECLNTQAQVSMSGAAGADDDATLVKLVSSDGHIVEMLKKHAKMSITLGNLLEGTSQMNETLTLRRARNTIRVGDASTTGTLSSDPH